MIIYDDNTGIQKHCFTCRIKPVCYNDLACIRTYHWWRPMNLPDYRSLLADCIRIRETYPDPTSLQYGMITAQIEKLNETIATLTKCEAKNA